MRRAAFVLLLALAAPAALAHGGEEHVDAALLAEGERLLLGRFVAPQPGPLVVVPYVEGELTCAPPPKADHRIALDTTSGVAFARNATTLAAWFDTPRFAEGYAALAIDTHDATRTLLLMEENAVALHALAGAVVRGVQLDVHTGAMGLPYPIPGTKAHHMGDLAVEGGGIMMAHDDTFPGATACASDEPGHFAILFETAALPDSLGEGALVHAVALWDPTLAAHPPRPLDGTTRVLQANLYLARSDEDPARVRDGLDPRLRAADVLPTLGLTLGLAVVGLRRIN